jgi:glycosyltransferase involved in cell wall biosynthesis
MFVRNAFVHDTRIIKEARSLISAGHEVEVIALQDGMLPDYEIREDKITVRRIGGSRIKMIFLSFREEIILQLKKQLRMDPEWIFKIGLSLPSQLTLSAYRIRFLRWPIYLLAMPFAAIRMFFIFFKSLLTGALGIANRSRLFSLVYENYVKAGVQSGADVYHAHDLNTLLPAVLASRRTGGSIVYDSHELFVNRNVRESIIGRIGWMWLESQIIRYAEKVITVSDAIADVLAERYKIERPVVIRNVQKFAPFQRSTTLRDLPGLHHICPETCIAIYAGRITHGRGLEILIEASRYLERVVIILMGGGDINFQKSLSEKISHYGIEHKVIFVPPVEPDSVHEYICSANLGLMPTENTCLSYYLGAGNKLFHYLMAGLPVIVSDHPEKRKIVKQYDVGCVFDEDNPHDLARVIQELTDNIELRRRLSANALEAAMILNWENEEKKLLDLYRSIEDKRMYSNR